MLKVKVPLLLYNTTVIPEQIISPIERSSYEDKKDSHHITGYYFRADYSISDFFTKYSIARKHKI